MRIIVFFDMPMETEKEKKAYRKFIRFLNKEGYIMLQKSLYSKLVVNQSMEKSVLNRLRNNNPESGLIQVLKVTEKQFASIENICGKVVFCQVDDTQRLVII